ncbi:MULTISPECIES: hypothetical protein [Pseudomonas]|uniref:Uncharacterized protein n=1 Tax=Pseudomonas jessenii TaxID=77298 RepID=A0A370SDY3_PSEJE|nr:MULTISPECIES: hypothetical protein [Pseudomonas]MCT8949820.1 hypothetical protein [Pseudomonas iridis]RDL17949.1 hypothetical protein DEU51_11018 [Pseudomonas jessenii]VVO58241.1 hypothetical protein PS876_00656 [Pseudomonas fluorescens]VVP65409.1 hypothetical protein PS906_00978 [Pseudomonas fluorescens]
MTNISAIGKAITESIEFISRVGGECDHLAKLIREEVSRALLSPEVAHRYKAGGQWIEKFANDEKGWINTELGFSLPVVIKPKRSICGYIVVQISLAGNGIGAADNHEPLIHVGWWGAPIDFEEFLMSFPLDLDSEFDLSLQADRLFKWAHSQYDDEWCYSLYLTDINSPADVQALIVNPVKALLAGSDAEQALSRTRAVRYEKLLHGEPGQYRTLPR